MAAELYRRQLNSAVLPGETTDKSRCQYAGTLPQNEVDI